MRPLVAHCHFGRGKCERSRGNRGQAQEHLTTGKELYYAMSMTHWLGQAGAEPRQRG
jgi:hypothetical protein